MDKIIEKEFELKRKMPRELKKDTMKSIIQNLLMVVIVLVILSLMCFMDEALIKETLASGLKALSIFLVVTSIIFFEIAYRREKPGTWIWAIEFLILGLIIMFVPYLSDYIQNFIIGIASAFGIYYVIKLLGIILHKKKEFLDQRSDIKEIIKDEKESYLDEVGNKKYK